MRPRVLVEACIGVRAVLLLCRERSRQPPSAAGSCSSKTPSRASRNRVSIAPRRLVLARECGHRVAVPAKQQSGSQDRPSRYAGPARAWIDGCSVSARYGSLSPRDSVLRATQLSSDGCDRRAGSQACYICRRPRRVRLLVTQSGNWRRQWVSAAGAAGSYYGAPGSDDSRVGGGRCF